MHKNTLVVDCFISKQLNKTLATRTWTGLSQPLLLAFKVRHNGSFNFAEKIKLIFDSLHTNGHTSV